MSKINELYQEYKNYDADLKKLYVALAEEVLPLITEKMNEEKRVELLKEHLSYQSEYYISMFAATILEKLLQDNQYFHEMYDICLEEYLLPTCYPVLLDSEFYTEKMVDLADDYYLLQLLNVLCQKEIHYASDNAVAFSVMEGLMKLFNHAIQREKVTTPLGIYAAMGNLLINLHPEYIDNSISLYAEEYDTVYAFLKENKAKVKAMLPADTDWSAPWGCPVEEKEVQEVYELSSLCFLQIQKEVNPTYAAQKVTEEELMEWEYHASNFLDCPIYVQLAFVQHGNYLDEALFAIKEVRMLLATYPSHAKLLLNDVAYDVVKIAVETLDYSLELIDHHNPIVREVLKEHSIQCPSEKGNMLLDVLKWDNHPLVRDVVPF